jgi:small subunit ribosomal protein S3
LNGAEIARTETQTQGSMPASTLKSEIDFALIHAKTTYGIIGVKVWIHKGLFVRGESENIPGRPIF